MSAGLWFYSAHTDYIFSLLFPSLPCCMLTASHPPFWLLCFFLPPVPAHCGEKGRQPSWDGEVFHSHISFSCARPSSASQHGFVTFLCSLCLPVTHVGCLTFSSYPKSPGARHNKFSGTANVGADVDCGDVNEGPESIYCKFYLSSDISSLTWQWTFEEVWLGCQEFFGTSLPWLLPWQLWSPSDVDLTRAFVWRKTHAAYPFWSPALLCSGAPQSDHILFLILIKPANGFVTGRGIWMGHTCLSSRLKLMPLS